MTTEQTEMKVSFAYAFCKQMELLEGISKELRVIGSAFHQAGNIVVGEKLTTLSQYLVEMPDELTTLRTAELDARLKQSQQGFSTYGNDWRDDDD